jgi:DNA polymerase III subunit epsilon
LSVQSVPLLQSGLELRSGRSLADRAVELLAAGPLATVEVGARVLALHGNPGAVAAAVFALLGQDPRVRVDGGGTWSLVAPSAPSPEPLLRDEEWVVVDVETTGGSPGHGHRVIEIAAVRVRGSRIVERYSSLVNPGRPIPRMITVLTGIDDRSVAHAPRFEEISADVADALRGRVFVGHNASFDWRFVSSELERCAGLTLTGRRLCTLRMARRLLPHLTSRSLGSLAEYFGIGMETHHRALDDAEATAHLLLRFLDTLSERDVHDWRDLESYLSNRSPRRRRTATPRSADSA